MPLDRTARCATLVLLPLLLLPFADPARADGWRYEWGFPRPQGNALHGLAFPGGGLGYAVGMNGCVLRSQDDAASWEVLQDHEGIAAHLYDLDVDGTVIVAVGEGVHRSTDGGLTFDAIANPASGALRDLARVPGGDLTAAGEAGAVIRSSDGGLTWTSIDVGVPAGTVRRHVWRSATDGWAAGDQIAHRTTDGGATWTQVLTVPFFGFNDVVFMDASTAYMFDDFGVGSSTDAGVSWVHDTLPLEPLYPFRTLPLDPQHWFTACFGEGGELFETTDGGGTWVQHELRRLLGYLDLQQTDTGRLVWCSDAGEIRYSDDGAQTVHAGTLHAGDFPGAPILRFVPRGDGTFFAGNQPNSGPGPDLWLRSDDNGRNWFVPENGPDLHWVLAGEFASSSIGMVGSYDDIRYTSDGGATWNVATLPANHRVASMSAPAPDRLWTLTYSTVTSGDAFLSTDGGATWSPSSAGIASLQGTSISFLDENDGWIFAGNAGNPVRYRTTDGGSSWAPAPVLGLPDLVSDLERIDANVAVAAMRIGAAPGIYRTTDGGAHWTRVSTERAHRVSLHPSGHGIASGVFSSDPCRVTTDLGATWSEPTPPLSHPFELFPAAITESEVTDDGLLLGSSLNRILWAGRESATDAPMIAPSAGSALQLAARPDPFTESVTVSFALEREAPVRVTVHDVTGRRVATLREARLRPGSHTAHWDGRDDGGRRVAAGAYFVRVRAGDDRSARRVTYLR